MTDTLCTDPQYWKRELRRHHERGPWETPELEATLSDSYADKTAMLESIVASFDS